MRQGWPYRPHLPGPSALQDAQQTKPVYTRRGERDPPSVVERCLCPQVNDLEYHLWPRTGLRVCASGDMGGGLMYLRYFEAGRGCRSAGSLKNPAAGDVSVTSYSCDFMLFPEPPRLLTSSTTISGPQIADAQQHESCRKMTPTQPSAAKSSLLGIDKLAELIMAKPIRRLLHQIFSCT